GAGAVPAGAGRLVRAGAGVAAVRRRVLPDRADVRADAAAGRAGAGGARAGARAGAAVPGGGPVDPRWGRLGRAGGGGAGLGPPGCALAESPGPRTALMNPLRSRGTEDRGQRTDKHPVLLSSVLCAPSLSLPGRPAPLNALTFDVEEYFQVTGFAGRVR